MSVDLNKLAYDKEYRVNALKQELTDNIIPKVKEIKKEEQEKPFYVIVPLSLFRMVKNYLYYDTYCYYYDKRRYNRYQVSKQLWKKCNS